MSWIHMKRLALLCLSGGVTAAIVACSGTPAAAPSPGPAAKVTVTPNSGSSGASPFTPAPSGKSAAAAAANYYRAIAAQNYRLAFTYLAANVTGPDGRRLTLQAFLQLARVMDGQEGRVAHFSVAGFQSMVVMTLDPAKVGPFSAHLPLAPGGSRRSIKSIDRISQI